ncbi:MAG: tetratricopeptide repeat protein [Pontiellaceae bacterium]|nr:tetratricopeptide repeat protein [Pontiellaceae bacterium]
MKTHYLALGACVFVTGMAYGVDLGPGRAAFDRGEYEEAYNQFTAAFREDPADLETNLALGEAAYMNKKYSHAVFAFERVLMAEPGNDKALLGMALALQALGRTEEALKAFAEVEATGEEDAIYGEAIAELEAALKKGKSRFASIIEASLAAVYDDNINYGTDNNSLFLPGGASKETAGIEESVDLYGTYDVGARNNWVLIGGLGLFNSWYDVAPEQELSNVRGYTGVRRLGKESMVELAGRVERLWYGHSTLVDLFAADAAYLRTVSSSDWLKTSLTVEQRNFDKDFDPAGSRDSVYVSMGQSWNHCFGSRNNNIGLGGDLFCEDAHSDANSYLGFRLRLDGQVELPGAVLAYAGARYRMADYDDPDSSNTEREDDRWDFVVGVKKSVSERLMLDLQAMHIRNDSNSALYDYERNRVSLTATFKF